MAGGEKKRVSEIERERGQVQQMKLEPMAFSDKPASGELQYKELSKQENPIVGEEVSAEFVGEMSRGNESCYGGPGYFFRTMDEAAQDFAMKYNDDSIRDNVEIASYIRKKGSYYFFDVPHGGTTEGVTSDRKMSEVDIVASIHTYAAYNSRIKELPGGVYTRTSLVPSFWDVKSVKETGLPLYTVTPDGTMFLTEKDIESEAGVIHYIFDADFPSDPNCHVRKNLLDANTMSDNDYISQDEYKRRKDQR